MPGKRSTTQILASHSLRLEVLLSHESLHAKSSSVVELQLQFNLMTLAFVLFICFCFASIHDICALESDLSISSFAMPGSIPSSSLISQQYTSHSSNQDPSTADGQEVNQNLRPAARSPPNIQG